MSLRAESFAVPYDTPEQLSQILEPAALTVVFASASADLGALSGVLRGCSGPVIACTTAGEIGPAGLTTQQIVGVQLFGDLLVDVAAVPMLKGPRHRLDGVMSAFDEHKARLPSGWRSVGVVLIDGLSGAEERLMAALSGALRGLPLVGGSAGDMLRFEQTLVWWDGAFRSDVAVVAFLGIRGGFQLLKTQHIHASGDVLVVTEAEPDRRIVREINGEPAAWAYARLLGIPPESLGIEHVARHPLVLEVGGEVFVRSIQRIEPDGSLVFYCAIEEGLVLELGHSGDLVEDLRTCLQQSRAAMGGSSLVIGFDCILRRQEVEQTGCEPAVSALMASNRVIGFHTYGEQRGGLHVNQTFTGLALALS